jgi:hypothetical protein
VNKLKATPYGTYDRARDLQKRDFVTPVKLEDHPLVRKLPDCRFFVLGSSSPVTIRYFPLYAVEKVHCPGSFHEK